MMDGDKAVVVQAARLASPDPADDTTVDARR